MAGRDGAGGDPPALLRVRGLQRAFDGGMAVDGLDLDVRRGWCTALLGHNGSGKSTVVRCLGGQLTPTRGSIEIDGHDALADESAVRALRAVVPDPSLDRDDLTVHESVGRVAAAHGRSDADVHAVLEEFGLTSRRDARPHQLSLGLQQRAQLACGFVRPFDLLVLDEPSQYLDLVATEHLVARLHRELARGAGIVLTSHDPDLARAVADEAIILEDGREVARGAPSTVLAGEAAVRAGLAWP
ncbi:ABC transporter ATP-binding protein [Nitriliruptor alkaliphilus]|uniref:ABC transporter ATP-binding protein n=1 Tax=Nitriliruptor alkaliphilus TaxID=427918 RepID=UPI0006966D38|nr:ABC transporter ATP-binding protein [Nitriliruptor alkaliphilus]